MRTFLLALRSLALATIAAFALLCGLRVAQLFGVTSWWGALTDTQRGALLLLAGTMATFTLFRRLTRPRPVGTLGSVGAVATLPMESAKAHSASLEDRAALHRPTAEDERETIESRQTRVRFHEAGHAAVALQLGFSIESISVIRDNSSWGRVQIDGHADGSDTNYAFWCKAIMASAGAAAELRMLGAVNSGGLHMDLQEVQTICAALAAGNFTVDGKAMSAAELVEEAQRRARLHVDELHNQIEDLESALRSTSFLSGERVARIFEETERNAAS